MLEASGVDFAGNVVVLALLLTPEGGPVWKLYSTMNFKTQRNCRQRSTIRQIVRKPEKLHCKSKSRTSRTGRRL